MSNMRKPPPHAKRPGADPPVPGAWGARMLHPRAFHARPLPSLGTGFQEIHARRFRLAAWLLEHHAQLGSRRANTGLLLALVDVLLAFSVVLMFYLASQTIDPDWWFLRLLLLVLALLTLSSLVLSAMLALFSAARLRRRVAGGAAETEAVTYFQSGAGARTGPDPFPDEEEFRQRFQQVTRQQMLEGVLSELYTQARFRTRQERWLRLALAFSVLALLLFGLTALGMFIGLIG